MLRQDSLHIYVDINVANSPLKCVHLIECALSTVQNSLQALGLRCNAPARSSRDYLSKLVIDRSRA